ncbi:MAG: tandem-95 repeat protein [Nitrospira sp.]|nr:tandem-95 repeat protein [Nitrospira sp.]MBH0183997.1 tandem-95 repeat protein [Nitrospira sp.]
MELAQLFYLRETLRHRARNMWDRWGSRRYSAGFARHRSSVSRQFVMEPLEDRVLLSATPVDAAILDATTTDTTVVATDVSGISGESALTVTQVLGAQPMSFEANVGQTDEAVAFLSRGPGYAVFLTSTEAVFSLSTMTVTDPAQLDPASSDPLMLVPDLSESASSDVAVLRLTLEGANSTAAITGQELLPGVVNYQMGDDPTQWLSGVSTYQKVHYAGVYEGIDMVFYGTIGGELEYDWVVAPGADTGQIRLGLAGAEAISLDPEGDLMLMLAGGTVTINKPVAYQIVNGTRVSVEASYELSTDETGQTTASFIVGSYDVAETLIIDPVFVYSTYLGGSDWDGGYDIAVDGQGQAYVTGYTFSTDFPTSNGSQLFGGGQYDAFVTKLDADGAVVYSTYLGGSNTDVGRGIAVDGSGQAYVTGYILNPSYLYPNSYDAFVTKLDADGAGVYSTYLRGNSLDIGMGIAVDGSGQAYVTGYTLSTDFPTSNASQGSNAGGIDAFVTKLNAAGALVYSTYVGGSGDDSGYGIAVDETGQAYVAGHTTSIDFPTIGASQGSNAGGQDAFVTKLDTDGALVYSTYVGGSGEEYGYGIAVDGSGQAYVTGYTTSADFATSGASQATNAGGNDVFVTKLDTDGALVYSTYVGGSGEDFGYGIAVDESGQAYVTGATTSIDFPTREANQAMRAGGHDAFVTKLDETGALVYSTYVGGSDEDRGFGAAVDERGQVYITGFTASGNFPTSNASQSTKVGSADIFVTKLTTNTAPVGMDQWVTTAEDTATTITPRVTDVDGDALTFHIVTGPSYGTLTENTDGSFSYQPNLNFSGEDRFTFVANDGITDSNLATVSLIVTPVNDTAVAGADTYSVLAGNPLTVFGAGVLANDSDVDTSVSHLQAQLVDTVTRGSLVFHANGGFTYTPAPGFVGQDSFTYRIDDGGTLSNTVTVVLNVQKSSLVINGTAGSDVIRMSELNGNALQVELNGVVLQYTLQAATQLRVNGLAGDDLIYLTGLRHSTLVDGGTGHDWIDARENTAPSGALDLRGGDGNDTIIGGAGNDRLDGGLDHDVLVGNAGNDTLVGNDGDDLLVGGSGNDVLDGGKGDDALLGGSGNDTLKGGENNDILIGGGGADALNGGLGSNQLLYWNEDAKKKQDELLSMHPSWVRDFV